LKKGLIFMEFLHFLAQLRTPAGNIIFQGITYLAQEFFVVAVMCWLFWCSDKKLAYTLGFTYFSSGLLVQGLKITFRIPRPWILDPDFQAVDSALAGATGYSFPSGHTQSITALFGTLGLHAKKVIHKLAAFLLIILVGFSRMYLGCHTPQDVLTAFVISIICALLCYTLIYKKEIFKNRPGIIAVIMAVLGVLLALYAIVLNKNGTIELSYAQDCVKASGAGIAFALGYYIEETRIRFQPPKALKDKILRLVIGLAATLVLLEGTKPFLGTSLPASFIRYFIAILWILVLYPLLFKQLNK
jgi:undecaprenyl-diphosphatase